MIDELVDSIQKLSLEAIEKYLIKEDFEEADMALLQQLYNRARLGMQFHRETNLGKRAAESNTLRTYFLIAHDKDELREYIRVSLPQYYPKTAITE